MNVSVFSAQYNKVSEQEKMSICSQDLIINDHGIYLMESGELTSVDAVYSNADGLFILKSRNVDEIKVECDNRHPIYHWKHKGGCGGCAN